MSYENQVSRPTYEHLLKEVQSFRDELSSMKRMYEDLFYNLDYDNFSSNLNMDMKKFLLTYKEVYPDGSKSESSISMTAEQIALAVSSEREYVTNLLGIDYYTREQMQSQLSITASGIYSNVSATYETKSNAGTQYTSLQSSISQTATSILSTVSATYGTKTEMSQVKQTADKIEWLVASGTNSSNFTLTSRTASLVASQINLTGYVTFTSLSTAGQTTINGGNITTGTIYGIRIGASPYSLSEVSALPAGTIAGGVVRSRQGTSGREVRVQDGGLDMYSGATNMGSLYIDTSDSNAVWLQGRNKLKLSTLSGDISINASSGRTVYADGNWTIGAYGYVKFSCYSVDFSGAQSVTGLPSTTAKWA